MFWKPFSKNQEKQILEVIRNAEKNCSGEIRVHVDEYCKSDPLLKAANVFEHLAMHNTALRNGVLIYVALKDRKFSIVGDVGINQKVPEHFWEQTKEAMLELFKAGQPVEAICFGIKEAGVKLQAFFPPSESDRDELKNDISYGA